MKVSIIIPIIRPDSAQRCIEAIHRNAGILYRHYEVIAEHDVDRIGCPAMVRKLTGMSSGEWVMFLGDDTEPQPGFLREALKQAETLPEGWGVVGLNTESPNGGNLIAHFMAHKKMLEHIPGGAFFSTEYKHCFCDNELRDIAKELDRWTPAENCRINHNHPINKTAEWDDHYGRAYKENAWKHDRNRYFYRKIERSRDKFGTKIAYAEPLTFQMIYANYHFSAVRMMARYLINRYRAGEPIGFEFLSPDYPGNIASVRNNLVQKALNTGCTHILMMDTDEFTEDDDLLDRLLSHDKPVVHAKVHRRYPPFDHILMRGDPDNRRLVPDTEIESGGLVEIDATGCGCVLYDMHVFLDLDEPWFEDGAEDIKFCNRLRKAGYKIFCDTSIDVKHLSLLAVDWGTHKLYKKLRGVRENG